MFIRNKEVVARFDQSYSNEASQPNNPLLPYFQNWEVDVGREKWLAFTVGGFATARLIQDSEPMASTLFGSCIPIAVDWENQESGDNLVTILHQAGFRNSDEVGQPRFRILEQFESLLPDYFKIHRLHTIRVDGIHPQPSNTENVLNSLHIALARLAGISVGQIDDIIIPSDFGYFDLVFRKNAITIYDRANASLKQKVIVY